MGCSSSVDFVANNKLGQDEIAMLFFEMICIQSSDIKIFHSLFTAIDLQGTGFISHDKIYFTYRNVVSFVCPTYLLVQLYCHIITSLDLIIHWRW